MADDLGYGDVGCYGNTYIRTPNIDALAAGGMRLTDYHSNGAVCSPTRAALLTGRYQQRCGINGVVTAKKHRETGMPLSEITFAEVLKQKDYATGLFGKWHVGYPAEFNPIKQGFDEFVGFVSGNVDYQSHVDQEGYADWWNGEKLEDEDGYTTDLITKYGERFIEKHHAKPFCLYLAHEAPHYPYQGPGDGPERKVGDAHAFKGRTDKKAAYKEMIEAMDAGVGKIVEKVRQAGIEKNTLIFFCSDNGPAGPGSAGGLRGKKGTLWEGGHRVPAIAYWPGKIKAGSESDETIMGMDMLPTMAAMAGAEVPKQAEADGIDVSSVMLNNAKLKPRTLFWQHKDQKAVRQGKWKLVVGKNKAHLFDLASDLAEKNDLAKTEKAVTAKMVKLLDRWQTEVWDGVEKRS
jgi:arylsulfatase A-like enzyme